jgi:hypothetical protein
METGRSWGSWTNKSMEEALIDIKSRLNIHNTAEYDPYLTDLLKNHLTVKDGKIVWPVGVRSALVYWDA